MKSFDNDSFSNMNDDSENSRMSIVSNNSETQMTSTHFESRINTFSETFIEKASLQEEYNKRPYLDTWFVPDLSKLSSTGQAYGICQMSKIQFNKHSVICGSLNSSSNFRTHLKVKYFKLIILIVFILHYSIINEKLYKFREISINFTEEIESNVTIIYIIIVIIVDKLKFD